MCSQGREGPESMEVGMMGERVGDTGRLDLTSVGDPGA